VTHHRRLALLAIFLIACAALALGQAAPAAPKPSGPITRLNRAPVSKEIVRVHLPKPTRAVLDNGVRVLILEDHRFPVASLQLHINGAGALYDPPELPGLAMLTASLMRQGTATRTSKQIVDEMARIGAHVGISAGFGSPDGILFASGFSEDFDQWLGLVADVLLHPSLPASELTTLKQPLRTWLQQRRSNAQSLLTDRFNGVFYRNHPAAVSATTPEALDAISVEQIGRFYREHYLPQDAILIVVGDVTPAAILPKLRQAFAPWHATSTHYTLPPNPPMQTARHVYLVDRPGSVQTKLSIGNMGIDRRHPDYFPLLVMNHILGGNSGARLFLNLRESKGYTYGAYSSFDANEIRGTVEATADVRTDVTEGAITEFFNEFERIVNQPPTADELDHAKRALVARLAFSLEQPDSWARYALIVEKYGFPADYWDHYADRVMAISAADVQRVAKKYYNPSSLQIFAVGDATKIRATMARWGELTVSGADGKVLQNAAQ
jgi:zinc protease